MPIQCPQWEYLICPVCEFAFELKVRLPITISCCGHTVCKACLASLQGAKCPFDQYKISAPIVKLPVNTALALLVDRNADLEALRPKDGSESSIQYNLSMAKMESLASFLIPSGSTGTPLQMSRPMQRKLVNLLNTQLLDSEGRWRAIKAARSLGERSVTELILQHQNPQQLSANLWAAVRARGCQFLGPAMQEEVLKLVLLALEDGSSLSRKVLVMFVVQKLEPEYPQASKTSIGHVVQLLYRASCFKVTKRDGDSSLMQLKEEFQTYDTLRREHDAQIVQIATEAGLRIAPDQWSSLLYGDSVHKSQMQSIIDKLQTPQSFVQSVQELIIALQRTNDPGHLGSLRPHLETLASIEVSDENATSDWKTLLVALEASCSVVSGLQAFISDHSNKRQNLDSEALSSNTGANSRYKTSMCRDLAMHSSCPRGRNCTFAHSMPEMEMYRKGKAKTVLNKTASPVNKAVEDDVQVANIKEKINSEATLNPMVVLPVAQVAPFPRGVERRERPTAVQTPVPSDPPPQQVVNMPQHQFTSQRAPGPVIPVALPNLPLMEDHLEEVQRHQQLLIGIGDPAGSKSINNAPPSMAAKSLSALKSRKEEIKDSLEDIVGRDETERLSHIYQERAKGGKSAGALSMAIGISSPPGTESLSSCYSIWTSRSILTLPTRTTSMEQGSLSSLNYRPQTEEDDEIPFSDTPQVSRFGPISRRGVSIMRPSKAKQSLASMNDEPMPTAVVRHSKQAAKASPPPASLLLQNGGRTTLQPVAVGVNGEIGYIAVPGPPPVLHDQIPVAVQPNQGAVMGQQLVPGPPPMLHDQIPVAVQPNQGAVMAQQPLPTFQHQQQMVHQPVFNPPRQQFEVDTASVAMEYERMKHEIGILQQKVSDLNLAMMQDKAVFVTQQQEQPRTPEAQLQKDLTSELQLIEKTIRDREMELQINQCMTTEFPRGLDYGSYEKHGLMDEGRGGEHQSNCTGFYQQFH